MATRLLFLLFLSLPCLASTECQSTFTAKNTNQVTWCVTVNGNIVQLKAPGGWVQIDGSEGYGICAPGNSYYDLGLNGDSGNWKPSVITQPKGPNTLPLTITRTTSDNQYTLTQTFSLPVSGKAVGVRMQIAGQSPSISLVRFAEVAKQGYSQIGNHTFSSAFIWGEQIVGLMAKPTVSLAPAHADIVAGGAQNPCFPGGSSINLAMLISWTFGNKPAAPYFEYSGIP